MRKLRKFAYHEPSTIGDAVGVLSSNVAARALAGGTDLIVQMKHGKLRPTDVVNLKKIAGLAGISYDEANGLTVGALTTVDEIARSEVVRQRYPALAHAAGLIGSQQVRNIATIGGNLCNASPSAETGTPVIAYDGIAQIVGAENRRQVPMLDFFVGPGKTSLAAGELLAAVRFAPAAPRSGAAYIKHCYREYMDLAVVGVSVLIALERDGERCADCRVVLGAVAPTPLRVPQAEAVMRGNAITAALLDDAAAVAAETCRPISDVRASAAYRRDMVRVLVRRAADQALDLAKSAL